MKKVYILILSAVAILSSCAKEGVLLEDKAVEEVQTEALHIATGFSASLPGSGTRTSVDMENGRISWMTDDSLMVSNGQGSMVMYVEEGGSTEAALYSKEEVFGGNSFYAVYPSDNASYSSGVFQSAIPTEQRYVKGGFAENTFPMVAICDSKRMFAFRNAASLLKIETSTEQFEGASILSMTLSADEPMAGAISVEYSAGKDPLVDCSAGDNSVSIIAREGGIPFGEPIYAVVAPGDYNNLRLVLRLSNGLSFVRNFSETISVNRSAYRSIAVEVEDRFEDLSATETANCYMVSRSGSYKFRVDVRGNGVETSCGLSSATGNVASLKEYYSDGSSFVDGGFALVDGYVYFSTVSGTLPSGTVLLSALDEDGNTLWSWHIWANEEIADVPLSNGSVWLNMNLGAHQVHFNPNGYNGYYYQWGRKDPFLQKYTTSTTAGALAPFVSHASAIDGSLEASVANPHIFYGGYHPAGTSSVTEDWSTYDDDEKVYDWWNKDISGDGQTDVESAKTMFDPCPAGYHVPVQEDLLGLLALASADVKYDEGGRTVDGKLYFPYSSYRYISIYAAWWPGGNEASRIFIPSATPYETTTRFRRRYYRMYMTSTPSQGLTNGVRSYAVPVRCIKDGTSVPFVIEVASVQLDKTSLDLIAGGSYTLSATVLPDNATDKTVVWSTSDASVATVEDGKVTAVAEGNAVITATASGKKAECLVNVKKSGAQFDAGIEDMDPEDWK